MKHFNLFQQSSSTQSSKNDPSFPTNPFLFSPIILIILATLFILGFLIGLSCKNEHQQSEINSVSRQDDSRKQSFQSDPMGRRYFQKKEDTGLSLGVNFSKRRSLKFNSCRKTRKHDNYNLNKNLKYKKIEKIKNYMKNRNTSIDMEIENSKFDFLVRK